MHKLLLGAHLSIKDGLENSIKIAKFLKINSMQIFIKAPLKWSNEKLTKTTIDAFKYEKQKSNVTNIFVHASHLIHIGSKKDLVVANSIKALINEINCCADLEINYIVIHLDSPRFDNIKESITFVATQLNIILTSTKHKNVIILIETMTNAKLGANFSEIGEIIKQINDKNRIGVCLDTCHIFTAGYDFSTTEKYNELWNKFDSSIGLKYLKLIHLNDSKFECNSQKDRHAAIGEGKIELNSFKLLLNDKKLKNIAKIIETPAEDDKLTADIKNLNVIKKLILK